VLENLPWFSNILSLDAKVTTPETDSVREISSSKVEKLTHTSLSWEERGAEKHIKESNFFQSHRFLNPCGTWQRDLRSYTVRVACSAKLSNSATTQPVVSSESNWSSYCQVFYWGLKVDWGWTLSSCRKFQAFIWFWEKRYIWLITCTGKKVSTTSSTTSVAQSRRGKFITNYKQFYEFSMAWQVCSSLLVLRTTEDLEEGQTYGQWNIFKIPAWFLMNVIEPHAADRTLSCHNFHDWYSTDR